MLILMNVIAEFMPEREQARQKLCSALNVSCADSPSAASIAAKYCIFATRPSDGQVGHSVSLLISNRIFLRFPPRFAPTPLLLSRSASLGRLVQGPAIRFRE